LHVLAGEVVQDSQHGVLVMQDIESELSQFVQRDQRLMVGDRPLVVRRLRPVRTDLQEICVIVTT
jgi:hypothetical protein